MSNIPQWHGESITPAWQRVLDELAPVQVQAMLTLLRARLEVLAEEDSSVVMQSPFQKYVMGTITAVCMWL